MIVQSGHTGERQRKANTKREVEPHIAKKSHQLIANERLQNI